MKTLYSKEQIAKRIKELGVEIEKKIPLGDTPLICVCVLRGAAMFFVDLVRELKRDVKWDFLSLSSYGSGQVSSGKIEVVDGLRNSVGGCDVLVIDDIVDSGHTVEYLRDLFVQQKAKNVYIACMLDKPKGRKVDGIKADFVGFELEGLPFVGGYGMDVDGLKRNVPEIFVV
ncbi:MAG: hypoxanthine phosphoribosyltransferase [Firmicutes bacterium]|nr:hypoxanthine phosphoribosyltransferase [Bacillota bacterium]